MASLKCTSASLMLSKRVPRLLWETACSGHRLSVCVCRKQFNPYTFNREVLFGTQLVGCFRGVT